MTVLCESHFFESRLFGLSELHLALLGSSRPLLGQSWGPEGTQKVPKAPPNLDQKWLQKGIQFWAALGPILGSILGSKTRRLGGTHFQGFSVKSRPRSKHSSFSCFQMCVCFLCFWGVFIFANRGVSKMGSVSGPVLDSILAPKWFPKWSPKWSQNQFFFKLSLGALFSGL